MRLHIPCLLMLAISLVSASGQSPWDLDQSAYTAASKGNYVLAIKLWSQAIEQHPTNYLDSSGIIVGRD